MGFKSVFSKVLKGESKRKLLARNEKVHSTLKTGSRVAQASLKLTVEDDLELLAVIISKDDVVAVAEWHHGGPPMWSYARSRSGVKEAY